MKLTPEEQDIVAENHNLIYGYLRDRGLDEDEWYGLIAISLCNAVKAHDPERGPLSTLFYTVSDNKVAGEYNYWSRQKRDGGYILSLDYEYGDDGDGESVSVEDYLGISDSMELEDEILSEIAIKNMMESEHGEVVRLRYLGYTQEEIAELTGYSQSKISMDLINMRRRYLDGEFNK